MPACHPVSEIALCPSIVNNIASLEADICSPVLKRASISLSFGIALNSFASFIRLSVVFPWADTTHIILFPSSLSSIIFLATIFKFILSERELPPNFNTIVSIFSSLLINVNRKFNYKNSIFDNYVVSIYYMPFYLF